MSDIDVIVIGAGPGGYVAAIRCAQLGLKTVCIDAWQDAQGKPSPGGTCLNVGCIPSKALIESSEHFHTAQSGLAAHGIQIDTVTLDLATLLARKDKVVRALTQGVAALFQAHRIELVQGFGRVLAGRQVEVSDHQGKPLRTLTAKHVLIATGSRPTELATAPFDHKRIVDSTGALALDKVPGKLGIIGAGVIALELGSVWNRLGSAVTLYKSSQSFLPAADAQLAKEALKILQKQGLSFQMGVDISRCEVKGNKVHIHYQLDGKEHKDSVDTLIVAVGRRPNSESVVGDGSGVAVDDRGFLQVDAHCRTAVDGVWAIGDVVRGPMLAHKASEEGVMVAERIAGKHADVDLDTVPSVIYTQPEMAWVGQTEEALKKAGVEYRVGVFPFNANGRAQALGQTEGMIKVLAQAGTDRILGVHMLGPQSSELIMQAKLAMDFRASAEDLAMTMYAHPTLSETLHEAALSVAGEAIHAVQKKRK